MVKSDKIGLNFERFRKEIDIYCWDLDGVLAVFAYGKDGVNVCDEASYRDYMKNNNPYSDAIAPKIIKEFIKRYTSTDNNYVITVADTDIERKYKCDFIHRNYNCKIKQENIIFVDSSEKKLNALYKIKQLNLNKEIALIDDTVKTLSDIQETKEFKTIHISSFLNFEEIF